MKHITFKLKYIHNIVLNASDFADILTDASNKNGVEIMDRQQLMNLYDLDKKNNLSRYFEQNRFQLNYYGETPEKNHRLRIENGSHMLDLIMTDSAFKIYFSIENILLD